jgi:hypothetical protein
MAACCISRFEDCLSDTAGFEIRFGKTVARPPLQFRPPNVAYFTNPGEDSNDHNDIWQDGAVLVDIGEPEWAAYFSAFNQQLVPTDELGNPLPGGTTI